MAAITVDSRGDPRKATAAGMSSSTIRADASHASFEGGGACGSFASAPAADAASARRHESSCNKQNTTVSIILIAHTESPKYTYLVTDGGYQRRRPHLALLQLRVFRVFR